MCVFVYVYVCVCACVHACMRVREYVYIYVYLHVYVFVYALGVHTNICVFERMCTYTFMLHISCTQITCLCVFFPRIISTPRVCWERKQNIHMQLLHA